MKILYYSSPSFADCDFPLVKALQDAGHDVTYVIKLAPYSLKSTLFDIKEQIPENTIFPAVRYPELKVYESYMDMSKVYIANQIVMQDSSLQSLKLTRQLISLIKANDFEVIHTDCMLGKWNLLLYILFGKKMVLTVHDPFVHSGEFSIESSVNRKIAMRCVQKIVLLNNKQTDRFCTTYKLNLKQILINSLGVYETISMFVDSNSNSKGHNVLFFGRISPYKGIEYLCKAMMKVKEQVPDATLTIAGGGKIYFDMSPYSDLGWMNVINRYVGMEELARLLQDSSVTVCPYTDATQSGVIMTSYSLCKPVVATNVGGLGEMVENSKTGLLVPPKDVDALADAIIALLKDDARREKMTDNIRNDYFVGDKTWKVIVEKYIEFYKTIL